MRRRLRKHLGDERREAGRRQRFVKVKAGEMQWDAVSGYSCVVQARLRRLGVQRHAVGQTERLKHARKQRIRRR